MTLTEKKELQGRSTQAIKKQRVEKALARPVTRVILDAEDNVILNVGELITHCAIRQAEASGSLNILLNSEPTPTKSSTNSEPEILKNGTPASPATALASNVLPVPGGPTSSTPLGIRAPMLKTRVQPGHQQFSIEIESGFHQVPIFDLDELN